MKTCRWIPLAGHRKIACCARLFQTAGQVALAILLDAIYHRTEFLMGMSQVGAIVFAIATEVDRI
jgi:hypothetical protein